MEKIKADVAELFREVFTEKLGMDGGYEIVEAAGDDVLLVRPAIIDLDITAPDTMSAGRSRTYTSSAGTAIRRCTWRRVVSAGRRRCYRPCLSALPTATPLRCPREQWARTADWR